MRPAGTSYSPGSEEKNKERARAWAKMSPHEQLRVILSDKDDGDEEETFHVRPISSVLGTSVDAATATFMEQDHAHRVKTYIDTLHTREFKQLETLSASAPIPAPSSRFRGTPWQGKEAPGMSNTSKPPKHQCRCRSSHNGPCGAGPVVSHELEPATGSLGSLGSPSRLAPLADPGRRRRPQGEVLPRKIKEMNRSGYLATKMWVPPRRQNKMKRGVEGKLPGSLPAHTFGHRREDGNDYLRMTHRSVRSFIGPAHYQKDVNVEMMERAKSLVGPDFASECGRERDLVPVLSQAAQYTPTQLRRDPRGTPVFRQEYSFDEGSRLTQSWDDRLARKLAREDGAVQAKKRAQALNLEQYREQQEWAALMDAEEAVGKSTSTPRRSAALELRYTPRWTRSTPGAEKLGVTALGVSDSSASLMNAREAVDLMVNADDGVR